MISLSNLNSSNTETLIEIVRVLDEALRVYNLPVDYEVSLPKRIDYTKNGLYDVGGFGSELDFGIMFDMGRKYAHLLSEDKSFMSPDKLNKDWDRSVKCYLYVSEKENFDKVAENMIIGEIRNVYSSLLDFCVNHRTEMVEFILNLKNDLDRKIERSRPITLTLGELEDLIERKIKESLMDLRFDTREDWEYNYSEREYTTTVSLLHGEDRISSFTTKQ